MAGLYAISPHKNTNNGLGAAIANGISGLMQDENAYKELQLKRKRQQDDYQQRLADQAAVRAEQRAQQLSDRDEQRGHTAKLLADEKRFKQLQNIGTNISSIVSTFNRDPSDPYAVQSITSAINLDPSIMNEFMQGNPNREAVTGIVPGPNGNFTLNVRLKDGTEGPMTKEGTADPNDTVLTFTKDQLGTSILDHFSQYAPANQPSLGTARAMAESEAKVMYGNGAQAIQQNAITSPQTNQSSVPTIPQTQQSLGSTQPVAEQPVVGQPVAEQPVAEQPGGGQPVAEQPVVGQPVAEQPVAEQPGGGQPVVEQQGAGTFGDAEYTGEMPDVGLETSTPLLDILPTGAGIRLAKGASKLAKKIYKKVKDKVPLSKAEEQYFLGHKGTDFIVAGFGKTKGKVLPKTKALAPPKSKALAPPKSKALAPVKNKPKGNAGDGADFVTDSSGRTRHSGMGDSLGALVPKNSNSIRAVGGRTVSGPGKQVRDVVAKKELTKATAGVTAVALSNIDSVDEGTPDIVEKAATDAVGSGKAPSKMITKNAVKAVDREFSKSNPKMEEIAKNLKYLRTQNMLGVNNGWTQEAVRKALKPVDRAKAQREVTKHFNSLVDGFSHSYEAQLPSVYKKSGGGFNAKKFSSDVKRTWINSPKELAILGIDPNNPTDAGVSLFMDVVASARQGDRHYDGGVAGWGSTPAVTTQGVLSISKLIADRVEASEKDKAIAPLNIRGNSFSRENIDELKEKHGFETDADAINAVLRKLSGQG